MKPAGYHVVPSAGSPMLILDRETAMQRAVQRHGHVTALYSLEQVAEAMKEIGFSDAATIIRNLDSI